MMSYVFQGFINSLCHIKSKQKCLFECDIDTPYHNKKKINLKKTVS